MPKTIVLIGALDTKGREFSFLKEEIEKRGHHAMVINVGVIGEPSFKPDIHAKTVAQASGVNLKELRDKADRGIAIEAMSKGIVNVVKELYDHDKIDGIISMGGGAGTAIGTAAMRKLPLGVPKVMVSTIASGDTKPYIGARDVVMFPSIVDVAGINRISARTFANAAGAVVGMVETAPPKIDEKPLLAATMFGNTTPIVDRCRKSMETQGYEMLVFHAVGAPETLENLVEEGYIVGLLDITTTEWADQITGGVCPGGVNRYDVLGDKGIPQVIVPGCLDMANFWARETVPEKYEGRLFYHWAPNVTLMRTTPEENGEMGRILAEKANNSKGPVAFLFPLKGLSMLDAPGKEFWWPKANKALFEAIKQHLKPSIEVKEIDYNINDDKFADAVSEKMLEFLREK